MTGKIEIVFTEENGKTEMDCQIDIQNFSKENLCNLMASLSKGLELTNQDWSRWMIENLVRGRMVDENRRTDRGTA